MPEFHEIIGNDDGKNDALDGKDQLSPPFEDLSIDKIFFWCF